MYAFGPRLAPCHAFRGRGMTQYELRRLLEKQRLCPAPNSSAYRRNRMLFYRETPSRSEWHFDSVGDCYAAFESPISVPRPRRADAEDPLLSGETLIDINVGIANASYQIKLAMVRRILPNRREDTFRPQDDRGALAANLQQKRDK